MELLILLLIIISTYFAFSIRAIKKKMTKQDIRIEGLLHKIDQLNVNRVDNISNNETTSSDKNNSDDYLKNEESNLLESVDKTGDFSGKTNIDETNIEESINNRLSKANTVIDKIKSSSVEISSDKKAIFSVESIITKLGILLLLIGVGFIFKLSYDSGIITEKVAILISVFIGILLIALGEFVRRKNRAVLCQVLYGGGLATLFITTYSAYQVYAFINSSTSFMIMTLITIITFIVAIHLDSMIMSLVAIIGGLLTPFFVDLQFIGIYGLGAYMIFLSVASMLIYVYKKWRALQLAIIFGAYLISSYLVTLPTKDIIESYQLAGLIFILYAIFNFTEFILTYKNIEAAYDKLLKAIILAILPIVTILQLTLILDISNVTWSIVCLAYSILYIVLWELLYRKNGYSIISDILLAIASLFLLFACLIYFEGALIGLSIIAISIVLSFVGEKRKHRFTSYGGHIIFAFGFMSSLSSMLQEMFAYNFEWIDCVSHMLILFLLIVGVLVQKEKLRMIYGIVSLEIYMILFIVASSYQLAKDTDMLLMAMTISFTLSIILISTINEYRKIVPRLSIAIVSLLAIFIRLLASIFILFTMEFELYNFIGFIIFALAIYGLCLHPAFKWGVREKLLFKLSAFIVVTLTILSDVYVFTDTFSYGLFIVGLIYILSHHFEVDKESKYMRVLNKVFDISWLVFMILYSFYGVFGQVFNVWHLVSDSGLLIILYILLKSLNIKLEVRLIVHFLVYIFIVHSNFVSLDFGSTTITLLWAAYSISALTIAVKKGLKSMANIALMMIVFVAGKFVIVDLSRASILWKIITSMIFGSALLLISYVLQPLFVSKEIEK